jgi:glutamate carboxypeptidase
MSDLRAYFEGQREAMLDALRDLVEMESPSHDKRAVDRLGVRVAELMVDAGAEVERLARDEVADVFVGRWEGDPSRPPILILAHRDTVWPVGTLAERPVRVEDGFFYGPGSFDMKAGIVIALTALRGLEALGRRPVARVTLLCNGDEEIGSPGSRSLIEELAAVSGLALCMEPAIPGGALKTARKGVSSYTVRVKGRPAHAGADHEKGVNAIEEMAHQVLALQALTDYERGTTVNVGTIEGGSATNVVPAECHANVDVRVTSVQEAERMDEVVAGLRPHLPGTEISVEGGLGHPPMVRDALMIRTFEQVARIAARHDIAVVEGSTGGGSDGSIAASMGAPTVDGLGADGDGGHAIHEHVKIDSLAQKAALLAALLSEWDVESGS